MFKKFIAAALAAISFSAVAGSATIVMLSGDQPIRYEQEHIVLNVVGRYKSNENNNGLGNVIDNRDMSTHEILIAYVDADSPPVKALSEFTSKWGEPKPGNCYIVGSKTGDFVLSTEEPWDTKFDTFKWTPCPYALGPYSNHIRGVVTAFGEAHGKYYLALNDTKPSWYEKSDVGIKFHLDKYGPIMKGECISILSGTDRIPYMPDGYAQTTQIDKRDCDEVSRQPAAGTRTYLPKVNTYKRVSGNKLLDDTFVLFFDDNTRLELKYDDQGLVMFKKENSRYPYNEDCVGLIVDKTKGRKGSKIKTTTAMILAGGGYCNEAE